MTPNPLYTLAPRDEEEKRSPTHIMLSTGPGTGTGTGTVTLGFPLPLLCCSVPVKPCSSLLRDSTIAHPATALCLVMACRPSPPSPSSPLSLRAHLWLSATPVPLTRRPLPRVLPSTPPIPFLFFHVRRPPCDRIPKFCADSANLLLPFPPLPLQCRLDSRLNCRAKDLSSARRPLLSLADSLSLLNGVSSFSP